MIYKKLFEIKKENIVLIKDTKWFNYKYATLDQIQNKINPILEKLNLIVFHNAEDGYLKTTIMDLEDESKVESKIKMWENTKAQDKWSEITYFRRYNLVSLLDLEVEDDDWQKASKDLCKVCNKQCQPWKQYCSKECFTKHNWNE